MNERAEYYRKTLEGERASRELADKQVLDLLQDIRVRYDIKLNSLMGKKGGKRKPGNSGGPDDADKGQDQTDWDCSDNRNGTQNDWGVNNNDSNDNEWGANDTGWGTNDATNDDNNVWNDDSTNNWDNQNDSGGWDDASKNSKKGGKSKSEAKEENWDNEETVKTNDSKSKKDDGDWGQPEEKKDNSNDKEKGKKGNTSKSSDKPAPNNKGKGDKGQNKNSKSNEDNDNKDNSRKSGNESSKKKGETKTDAPEASSTKNTKDKSGHDDSKQSEDKNFAELKSELLTTKLDLRLLERDKITLTDEIVAKQKEIDDLTQKLAKANEQIDTLRVKTRGLTVDLVATNDEIHKLNERIDELEAERRSKDRDVSFNESKRKAMENKFKEHQRQIADLQSELCLAREEKETAQKRLAAQSGRIDRLEADLNHSKNLIQTLKDGCTLVESQAKAFEIRHNTVVMSKEDLERELIAIKEESSRHITTISKLQKSNEQISKAFVLSIEAHEETKKELEVLHRESARSIGNYQVENHRLVEANNQLRKLIDYLQKKR